MSASKGIWSSWKPVNEANNHGLDMADVRFFLILSFTVHYFY